MYARGGRPSVPPEQLLRVLRIQIPYSVRSERLLIEQFDHDRLFRWFVGLGIDDEVWVPETFPRQAQPAAGSGGRARVLPGRGGTGARPEPAAGRSLHGRRHETMGLLDELHHRGKKLAGWTCAFTSASYDRVRLRTRIVAGACP